MWPLPTGLLLERLRPEKSPSSTSEALGGSQKADPLSSIGTPSRFRIKDSDIPTFFSLLHPLEEVKPLATLDEDTRPVGLAQTETDLAQPKLFCSSSSRIIFSSSDVPILVIYDEETQQHSLCLLRRDTPDDADLNYDVAKQHHTSILSNIGQSFPGVDEIEFIRDRAVRAALLEQEYLIRPDLFLEYLPVAADKGVLSKNQKSDPAHHIFLCAGETPQELGLCFLLPHINMLECYYISQDSLKGTFAISNTLSTPSSRSDFRSSLYHSPLCVLYTLLERYSIERAIVSSVESDCPWSRDRALKPPLGSASVRPLARSV
jgi:hypothetical protein